MSESPPIEEDDFFLCLDEADEPERRVERSTATSFTAVQLEPGWLANYDYHLYHHHSPTPATASSNSNGGVAGGSGSSSRSCSSSSSSTAPPPTHPLIADGVGVAAESRGLKYAADYYLANGQWERAADCARILVECSSSSVSGTLSAAAASPPFKKLSEPVGRTTAREAQEILVTALLKLERAADALPVALARASADQAHDVNGHRLLARVYSAMPGHSRQAATALHTCISVQRNSATLWMDLGNIYSKAAAATAVSPGINDGGELVEGRGRGGGGEGEGGEGGEGGGHEAVNDDSAQLYSLYAALCYLRARAWCTSALHGARGFTIAHHERLQAAAEQALRHIAAAATPDTSFFKTTTPSSPSSSSSCTIATTTTTTTAMTASKSGGGAAVCAALRGPGDWNQTGADRLHASIWALRPNGHTNQAELLQADEAAAAPGLARAQAAHFIAAMAVRVQDAVCGLDFERYWFQLNPPLPINARAEEEAAEAHEAEAKAERRARGLA